MTTLQHKVPDKKQALSLFEGSRRDMAFTLTLKPSSEAASTIVRNIYECFRMLGKALLVYKGLKSEENDHKYSIDELLKLKVSTSRPINLIENLRKLRHNINYNGYSPTLNETEDAISLAKSCFEPLSDAVFKEITNEK